MSVVRARRVATLALSIAASACLGCARTQVSSPAGPADSRPSRIILGLAADPAHAQPVTWRTPGLSPSAAGQLAAESSGAEPPTSATNVAARGSFFGLGHGQSVAHYEVTFTNLQPNTRYLYRVGDGSTWSGWNAFRTADAGPTPFRFVYLGDAQNDIATVFADTVRAARTAVPDARLFVHAGDLLAEGYDDDLWGEWCRAMAPVSATVPSVAVPGSHDLHRVPGSSDASYVLSVSPLWHAHLALPGTGPADAPELRSQTYLFDYQGVRFIALDVDAFAADEFQPAQRDRIRVATIAWLRHVLATNPNRWTIVVQHQAMYAIAKNRNYAEMRAALGPIFDEFSVDLVLQGHDHAYGRTRKVAAGQVVSAAARGTIYAIAVAGGKMYNLTYTHKNLMAVMRANIRTYQVIAIDRDRLRYDAYATDGTRVDAFELRKPATGPSLYVEISGKQDEAFRQP
jgi:3',5'-cyclic AMP phosphodiesterase CpdA